MFPKRQKKKSQSSQNIKAGGDSFLQGYVPQLNNGIARSIKWLNSQWQWAASVC